MYLVFINQQYPCATPFVLQNLTLVALPTQALTLAEMVDLNVLPVIFNNKIQVDVDDGVTHASTYLLNSSFDFIEMVSPATLMTLHHADIGVKFTAIAPHCIASLVSMYDHFTLTLGRRAHVDTAGWSGGGDDTAKSRNSAEEVDEQHHPEADRWPQHQACATARAASGRADRSSSRAHHARYANPADGRHLVAAL
ncbi:hypothetical protein C8R44DRAFT_975997 [Mycena epipterygia]|nr:hypothetical protein C8R44DRAFT_975997 [Mycena epipterygia]